MGITPDWSADAAIGTAPTVDGWSGPAWRLHKRRYPALAHEGSLRRTGRYHRASDRFPVGQTWPVLYLALDRAAALGEIQRHLLPALVPHLNDYRLTTIRVDLHGPVLLMDHPAQLGLSSDDLCHDTDWDTPQRLALAAQLAGMEAIVVPSATLLGNNLIVFPARLQPGSTLVATGYVDPRLFVPRGSEAEPSR